RVKASTTAPTAVGFGISTSEQVRAVAPHADGVIVGSAIVQQIEQHEDQLKDPAQMPFAFEKIKTFVQQLASALQ
ncbi:tryptophan synthase subunit alpha, partial [Acinetobacter baumannii]